jgi:hypothetical protein
LGEDYWSGEIIQAAGSLKGQGRQGYKIRQGLGQAWRKELSKLRGKSLSYRNVMEFSVKEGSYNIEAITYFKIRGDRLFLDQLHIEGAAAVKIGRKALWVTW